MNTLKVKRFRIFIHTFMAVTILAYAAMLFFSGRMARILFTIGGSSWYIALGLGSAAEASRQVNVLCLLWLVLFPVALTISYVLTYKKCYLPFCIVTILDFLVVFTYTLHSFCVKNTYSFQAMLPDLIISFIVSILIIRTTCLLHQSQRSKEQ